MTVMFAVEVTPVVMELVNPVLHSTATTERGAQSIHVLPLWAVSMRLLRDRAKTVTSATQEISARMENACQVLKSSVTMGTHAQLIIALLREIARLSPLTRVMMATPVLQTNVIQWRVASSFRLRGRLAMMG